MPGRGHRHDCSGVPIVVTENVQDYRECVPHYITKNDVVLELGSAQGCTTTVIAQYAQEVVGIDKSGFNADVSQRRYPNISFANIDAFDLSSVLRLGKRFTVIFIDISGSQPIGPVANLIEKYERVFQPELRLFVIKNVKLKRLVGLSRVFPEQVLNTTRNKTARHLLTAPNGNGSTDALMQQPASAGRQRRGSLPGALAAVGAAALGLVAGVLLGRSGAAR